MNLRELEAQADFLAPVIAAAVAKAVAPLQEQLSQKEQQIQALHDRINELPAPAEPIAVDLEALAKAAAELIPAPENGKDAAEVDLAAVAALVPMNLEAIAALVQVPEPDLKAIADMVEVPAPDLNAIAALVPVAAPIEVDLGALAKAAAELIPAPENGKDAAEVDLEALAKAAAALIEVPAAEKVDLAAVAALVPVPENGKDAAEVDLAAVAALVQVPEVDLESLARAAAALVPAPIVPPPEHGRDALDIQIEPTIDESKQYPRGTYAAHRGGLWKSYERTNGMRGWECIVDGIDGVTVTQDSVREFTVTLSKSSGTSAVQKFSLPVQVYKGVYREGEPYEANDTATWAGSVWVCNKDGTADKPGTSDDWTLAVKAGRAGKDLRENASHFDPAKGVKL